MDNGMKRFILFLVFVILAAGVFAQGRPRHKKKKKASVTKVMKTRGNKLPSDLYAKLNDSTDVFVINHATEFQHIDLPKKNFNTFNSYIRDSAVAEVPGIKSLLYYHYTLQDGRVLIGDIFWNDTASYIVFKIYDKKYVNYFSRDGVEQLRSLFKL
jgi:hypothetical protein